MEILRLGLKADSDIKGSVSGEVDVEVGSKQSEIIPDRREAFLDGQFKKEVPFPPSTGSVDISCWGQEPDWGDKGRYNNQGS